MALFILVICGSGNNMEMFYYDSIIAEYEQHHKFHELLSYLLQLYSSKKNIIVLDTIIAYSWYFASSPEYDYEDNYNYDEFIALWNQYIDIGIQDFSDNPCFNFIAGYTLGLHYVYISVYRSDQKEYIKFMAKAAQQSINLEIKLLAKNFIANEKSHGYIYLNNNDIIYSLFPSDSLLDIYFRQIYLTM